MVWGTSGTANGQFNDPSSITYNPTDGLLYVTDYENNRIQVFNSMGVHQRTWGIKGSGAGQMLYPYRLTFDSNGFI